MSVSNSSLMKKSSSHFTTREINPRVISPGLIALFAFLIILPHALTVGQSSTTLIALVFFGTIAFPMILSPLYTTIKITEDRIDWKVFGMFGTAIYFDELREIRIHHRFCVKLDTGMWSKPDICPVDRDGFLRAIRKAKPDLTIKGWNHPHKSQSSSRLGDPARIFYLYMLPPMVALIVFNYVFSSLANRIFWTVIWGIGGFYSSFVFFYWGMRGRMSFKGKILSKGQLYRFSLLIGLFSGLFFALLHYV